MKEVSVKKEHFKEITEEMAELFEVKNIAYGDSFSKSFNEYGMAMPCIRLEDKLNRLKNLVKGAEPNDESIKDTLIDLANYSVMTIMEMENEQDQI